jgi:protein-disulfide isomerase
VSRRRSDAARKARRRSRDIEPASTPRRTPLVVIFLALLLLVSGFVAFRVLGSNGAHRTRQTHSEIQGEVAALLDGIPQQGATLGSPKAPVTLRIYADLECRSVRRFFLDALPRIIETWVRPGTVKLEYRSLETDSIFEPIFIRQEIAALAAGSQGKLWNFADTFVHEQGKEYTRYATPAFLAGIAAQIPDLDRSKWLRDQRGHALFVKVAAGYHHGQVEGLDGTPSFLIGRSGGPVDIPAGPNIEPGPLMTAEKLARYVRSVQTLERSSTNH